MSSFLSPHPHHASPVFIFSLLFPLPFFPLISCQNCWLRVESWEGGSPTLSPMRRAACSRVSSTHQASPAFWKLALSQSTFGKTYIGTFFNRGKNWRGFSFIIFHLFLGLNPESHICQSWDLPFSHILRTVFVLWQQKSQSKTNIQCTYLVASFYKLCAHQQWELHHQITSREQFTNYSPSIYLIIPAFIRC